MQRAFEVDSVTDFDFKNPNYVPILKKRSERIEKLRKNPELLIAAKKHYAAHPWDFINDWGMTYDPRKKPAFMPFILFPRQIEYLEWLNDRYLLQEDALAEKCRDVGFTWLNVGFAATLLLFHEGISIGFGSRKGKMVDNAGDPDSIFEKIRIFIRNLPKEFRPVDSEMHHMRIINHDNGSTITGESGDNIGRGGRKSIYFKDESAFYERPMIVEAALSQNSNCKIDCSTPNGSNNPFYEKRMSGVIPVFTFNWHDDPRKDQAWFDRQVELLDPAVLAQEVLIDYHASKTNMLIDPKWISAAVQIELEATGSKIGALDVADEEGEDTNAVALGQGCVIEKIEEWNGIDTTLTAQKANLLAKDYGVSELKYDCIGVGAGVRGELNQLAPSYTVTPFNAGGAVINPKEKEFGDLSNADRFANLKSQMWWRLRVAFEKTYKKMQGDDIPDDECISIPNNSKLISELSQIQWTTNNQGKVIIEKKPKGSKSPNLADSVMIWRSRSEKPREIRTFIAGG